MPDHAAAFDRLTAEFYEAWFHYHPDLALVTGVPRTGRLLPAQDDDDRSALGGWLEELLLGLDELDFAALDPDRQLDLELMAGAARVEHRELRERDWRVLDPLRGLPSAALDPSGGPAIAAALARLLAELPAYLRESQVRLQGAGARMAPLLAKAAVREAERGTGRLRALASNPSWRPSDWGSDAAQELADQAARALGAYRRFLVEALAPQAGGPLACGEEHLRYRLHHLHFIDWPPDLGWGPVEQALSRAADALAAGPRGGAGPVLTLALTREPSPPAVRSGLGDRLPRRLANGATLTQGLPLFLGARDGAPGADGRPWPAWGQDALLRARLDLDLHRGRIEPTAALADLGAAGLDQDAAEAVLVRLARAPGDALAAVLGWHLLEQGWPQREPSAGLVAPDLLDRLLSQGEIPLLLVLRRISEAGGRAPTAARMEG